MRTIALALVCGMAATAMAGPINMVEIARVDLSSRLPGGLQGSGVAWNGRDAWVSQFNNGSDANTVGIFKVSNVLGSASLGNVFGQIASTPGGRGYSGIDILGDNLAAAYDDGAADNFGITSYNTNTETLNWSKNARGGSGVAFDPGFNNADSGVAWTTFGSGRRALQNAATGADIYTTANGMIINSGSGTFWRDIDFDDATGDLYARRSNGLFKTTRTGGNSGTVSTLIAFNAAQDFINGHNLAFMGDTIHGDIVVYNDRLTVNPGQTWENVVKIVDSNGVAQTVNWTFLSAVNAGNGYYSFSYDAATHSLAVVDFVNETLHVFSVPTPGAAGVLGLAGLVALRRRR